MPARYKVKKHPSSQDRRERSEWPFNQIGRRPKEKPREISRFGQNVRAWPAMVVPRYSMRRACIGEMEAARLAGMMAAKKEQMARATAAALRASGSQEETPYNWAESKRPAPTARGNPR